MTDKSITKVCNICKVEQPTSNFYPRGKSGTAVVSACKPCALERRRNPVQTPPIENLPNEEWRVCIENPAYAVSNKGRVKRIVSHRYSQNGETLVKPIKTTNGYLNVVINKPKHTFVHRLVCRAFHGEPLPEQTDVNHIDNDRTNNCADNLHWCTRKENLHWGKQQGRDNKGERNGQAKLQPDQVREIKRLLRETNLSHSAIGAMFGVSDGAIQFINVGRTWKHIE